MMLSFNAGSMLFQLETALSCPENYHGDPKPLYDDVKAIVGKLGIAIPEFTALLSAPSQLESIWRQLSLLGHDDSSLVRLGRLGTGLALTGRGQNLDDHPFCLLANESREILRNLGIDKRKVDTWLSSVGTSSDRAKVMMDLTRIVQNIGKPDHAKGEVDVFVSYSTKDTQIAEEIAKTLRDLSFSVFLAHQTITVGPTWEEQVAVAARSCRIAVLVLSESSLDSDWVRYEIGALWALQKQVAPALLGITNTQLPELIRRFQSRPASSTEQRHEFCREIQRILNSEP